MAEEQRHVGRPTLSEEALCNVAERLNQEASRRVRHLLADLEDDGVFNEHSLAQVAARLALVECCQQDCLRIAERAGAPTRPF